MTKTAKICSGDQIGVRYRILLTDGSEVESSGEEVVTLVVGSEQLPDPVSERLVGRAVGECFKVAIGAADEAFGSYDPQNVQAMGQAQFQQIGIPEVGALVEFALPDGEPVAGHVVRVGDEEVLVDFNHPLAGRDCIYEIEIVEAGSGRGVPESRGDY